MTARSTSPGLAPVITIDGPTASGKGTVAHHVAHVLGWAVLDSGVLYRLTALSAMRAAVPLDAIEAVSAKALALDVAFRDGQVWLDGAAVDDEIRQEAVGNAASRIAALWPVREALLERQRAFRRPPGLVADGRDMGTIVFPDAPLKIFLVADVQARAERRCNQLKAKGIPANLDDLLRDLQARDARDTQRTHAPLVAAADAHVLDSSTLTIEETTQKVLSLWQGVHR